MRLHDGTLRVMRYRNFRLFWIGFLVSNAGAWIQSLAQGWVVYEISHSAVWLGAIGFIRAFPLIILSLVGGTLADRFDLKKILYAALAVQTVSALALGILTSTGRVAVWHVIALAAISAAAQAFEQPARQTLVPAMVPRTDLHAAISLNAIAFNGAAAFGPSLAGILVPLVGLAGCFYLNAISYGAVFLAMAFMDFPPAPAKGTHKGLMVDLVEGLRYIAAQPTLLALISMAAVTSFAARPYNQFLTVYAADVLHGSVGVAGLLQSAPSVGTIIFMLLVASLGNIQWKGKMLLGSGLLFTLALIAFAWSRHLVLSLLLLVIVGGMAMIWQTTINTLLQTHVGDEMRGRVMASYTITAMAMVPLGQGPMGYAVQQVGPERAVTLGAGISLLFILFLGVYKVRAVRQLS